MAVTIERFDLLPSPPPAPSQAAQGSQAQGQQQGGGDGSAQQPSRHDFRRSLQLEHSRAARLRAY